MWRRSAFTALAVLVLWTFYWVVDQAFVTPISAGQTQLTRLRAEVDDLSGRLLRSRKELDAISGDLPEGPSLVVSGMDTPAALAWIQGLVRNEVAAAQGTALAFQATTSPLGRSHEKVSVMLRARFSEEAMLSFVRRLEESSPPVIFEQLEIQQLGTNNEAASLDVTATITAFHVNAAAS